MKKLIAFVLAAVLAIGTLSMVASADEAPEQKLAGQKIGLMIYSTTTPWAINIIDAFEAICEAYGAETAIAEAGNPGEVMTAAENLAGAGVTGVMCMMDGSIGDKVQEYFDSKQIPVSYAWGNYIDADYFASMSASEYYAGSVSSMDYEAAVEMTQYCIDLGADKWVFLGMPEGSGVANDNRAIGFKDTLEANGLELLAEVRSYDKVEGSQNLITNYPELNGFGAGLNAAKNAGGVLEQAGLDGANQVYMFAYEAAEDYVVEYFDAERLHGVADGCIGHMEVALALLFNAMLGQKVVDADGLAGTYRMPYLIAHNSEDYTTMHTYTYDGALPYEIDEFDAMIGADYDAIEAITSAYSLEDLAARR